MSILAVSGASPVDNSSGVKALEGQAKKIAQQLKATQSDTKLDAKAKAAKMQQLQARLQQLMAQVAQMRGSQQGQAAPAAAAPPAASASPKPAAISGEKREATAPKKASDSSTAAARAASRGSDTHLDVMA